MEDRIAFIIGNGAYSHMGRLRNPTNDAALVAGALLEVGFELVGGGVYLDVDKPDIEQGLLEFSKRLHQRATGLFYFSGHGVQLGGTNYLVPISANPARITHIETELVDIAAVLEQMYRAQTLLNIVLLDACRNNPFAQGLFQGTGTGLAAIQAAAGTVLSYATQPGNVALDGSEANSPYALAIVEALQQPGRSIFEVFNTVGLEVSRRTGGAQMPWMSISPLPQIFYFRPPVEAQPVLPASAPVELRLEPGAGALQQAIDTVSPGGTIRLAPGTYRGNLRITRPVHLMAEGAPGTVILAADDGEAVLGVEDAGEVRLQGLTMQAAGCPFGLLVERAAVRLEECRLLTTPTPAGEEARSAGVNARQQAQVDLLQGSIQHFDYALYSDGASVVTGDGLDLTGRWTGEQGLDCYGVAASGSGRLHLSNSRVRRFRQGSRAGFGEQDAAEMLLESCTFSEVEYGLVTVSGTRATVRSCDILFTESAVFSYGTAYVEQCRRLSAQNDQAWGLVSDTGRLSATDCRIFGGNTGALVRNAGVLQLEDCEIFDTADEGVYCSADAQVHLQGCRVHHHRNRGVHVKGKAVILQSTMHDNDYGVVCNDASSVRIVDCQLYENQVALICDDQAQVELLQSLLFGQTTGGVLAYGQCNVQVRSTTFRHNQAPVYACGTQTSAAVLGCDLRRNALLQTITTAEGAVVQQAGNQFSNQEASLEALQPHDYTQRSHSDFFIARFSRVLDLLDRFFYQHLRDWSLVDRRLSPDGKRCTYRYGRSTRERVQLEPHGLGRLADGINQGPQITVLDYALRLEVEIMVAEAVADTEKVSVRTEEDETIRSLSGGAVVGPNYWAPSLLVFAVADKNLPVGELLLYYLQIELAPAGQ